MIGVPLTTLPVHTRRSNMPSGGQLGEMVHTSSEVHEGATVRVLDCVLVVAPGD